MWVFPFLCTDISVNIMLSVDSLVSSQEMITTMDLIRLAGGTNLSVATE